MSNENQNTSDSVQQQKIRAFGDQKMDQETDVQSDVSCKEELDQEANENDCVFQTIKEHRNTYFVRYTPARSGAYFAYLALVFIGNKKTSEIVKHMEKECHLWIQRYPVPLMVTAFNDTDSVISLEEKQGSDHLIGMPENGTITLHWRFLKDEEFASGILLESDLRHIYQDISFTSQEERRRKAISSTKPIRRGIFIIAMWGLVVPIFIATIGFANPFLGYTIIAYSIGKAVLKTLKMLGYIKRSDYEKKTDAEELRMRHHHYHCEQNPKGFLRLMVENLERETKDRTHREFTEIKCLQDKVTDGEWEEQL